MFSDLSNRNHLYQLANKIKATDTSSSVTQKLKLQKTIEAKNLLFASTQDLQIEDLYNQAATGKDAKDTSAIHREIVDYIGKEKETVNINFNISIRHCVLLCIHHHINLEHNA